MDVFLRFLEPYRKKSKKLPIYPLFLSIKGIEGWDASPTSNHGNWIISIPKDSWNGTLKERLQRVASSIPGLHVNGITIVEIGYHLDLQDDGSLLDDMRYLKWLWNPMRMSTLERHMVESHRYRKVCDARIVDILERAPPVIIEPTDDMRKHPFWPFYVQIENHKWQIYRNDAIDAWFDVDETLTPEYWLVFAHGHGDGIVHHGYNPDTHVISNDMPAIIKWMDLHRHPILYQR